MTVTLDTFRQDKFRGEVPKLPLCLLLAGTHLFIKEEALKLCGWVDKSVFDGIENAAIAKITKGKKGAEKVEPPVLIPFAGIPTIHTFNGGTDEGGLAFPTCRMHVLSSSPRLVEVTDNGAKAGLGRKGSIIGNYEFPDGCEIHESYDRESNLTTLRTLHMIYLVGGDNKPLHKVPLVLSVHGGAATIFGKALELFYKLTEIALTEHYNDDFYTLSSEARAALIFQPTFGIEEVGTTKTSPVCSVESFIEPEAATVETHFNLEQAEYLWNVRKSLGSFAAKYMQEFAQYHPIAPGVELDEFPDNPNPMPEEVKQLHAEINSDVDLVGHFS